MPASIVDHVCGASLATWDRQQDRIHAGTIYHFCSAQCSKRFARNPGRYPGPAAGTQALRRVRQRARLVVLGLGRVDNGATKVQQMLHRTAGVLWAFANPATETVFVEYHAGRVTRDDLVAAIGAAGYHAFPVDRNGSA